MKDLRKLFAAVSLLFLLVLAVSPLKDEFREWKSTQAGYNRLIAELPRRVKPVEIGIRQIWVQKLDRVDRCVTCHLGVKEPALKSAPEPFRKHPDIHHDVEEFGCTICHEGQGAATEYRESAGRVKYWDRPVTPRAYLEASCGRCHKENNVSEAPVLNMGRKLLRESNCAGCHRMNGYAKQWVPSLDGIGDKVNRAWLVNWLKHPKSYDPGTKMPDFNLPDDEVNTLADFLLSFKTYAGGAEMARVPPQLAGAPGPRKAKMAELGATRFREARCISCHPINGKGGYVAPELGKIASKVSLPWLYNYVRNPKELQPGVLMPRFRFRDEDLVNVVAYMESEFVDFDAEAAPAHTPDPGFFEKGKELFRKYSCGGCHGLSGMGSAQETAPDLSNIGNKRLYEIDFGKSGIEETLPSYLTAKILSPRIFGESMKMPRFGFREDEARAIAVALMGNTAEHVPAELTIPPSPASTYSPQGDFGKLVNDLACLGCHVINGRGRLVATDLSLEASQARRNWIEAYFKVPYSLRPVLTERMPNFFLSDAEIKTLVDYMETSCIADSLEHTLPADPGLPAAGKVLYYERYGCQSCHQIGAKGGYVGPPLDKAGTRLTPGWVFHWLKNPQGLKPGTIEPNNSLTDADADAVTAFLMTLK